MKKQAGRKKKQTCSPNSDIISNLPTEVTENILSCMPLRDAMKTSMLSKKWRYKWLYLSKLVFDETFGQVPAGNSAADGRTNLLFAIFQVLLLHRGNLLKFTLSIPGLKSCPEMDRLILFLSSKNVQELELYVEDDESLYKLPPSLFLCMPLSIFKLQCCIFNPPPTFTGFHKLVCVEFYEVNFTANHAIESFISKCPLREELTLEYCSNTQRLEIDAPNLVFFSFTEELVSISFKNTPVLATVIFYGYNRQGAKVKLSTGETSNLIKTFIYLHAIVDLYVDWNFLLYLSAGKVPESLPTTLEFLEVLEFHKICFGIPNEVYAAFCLIRSSPNLRKLKIQFYTMVGSLEEQRDPVLHLLGDQDPSDDCLHQLPEVPLTNLSGTMYIFDMVRFLLARSSTLKKMVIQPRNGIAAAESLKILKEVTRFKRVSPYAEIKYLDPDERLV